MGVPRLLIILESDFILLECCLLNWIPMNKRLQKGYSSYKFFGDARFDSI